MANKIGNRNNRAIIKAGSSGTQEIGTIEHEGFLVSEKIPNLPLLILLLPIHVRERGTTSDVKTAANVIATEEPESLQALSNTFMSSRLAVRARMIRAC